MLVSVETFFHDALLSSLPDGVTVSTGPSLGPTPEVAQLVEVIASGLKLALPGSEDLTVRREPAFLFGVHRWKANGTQLDFVLPDDVVGQVVEVESPPGYPLRRGDEYAVEGRTVRFYRPPAQADVAVVARLRGAQASGFLERASCDIPLVLRAWSQEPGAADRLLSSALTPVLIAATGMGNLDNAASEDSGVRIRLLRPSVVLVGLTRGAELLQEKRFFRAQAEFLIRGELEQLIAVGAPEPTGIIREVRKV
ncbi:hypothetical protein [Corallococcus carmarthensis]|uniref:Uncharacterized protein n=1 Tax=Corallococcus carmarthensis TaxID=2316728 RepID=A0A3A8KE29_9BACT|nr:hypothetical protein [Corallococcus carmarthensis]NOK17264.1 hypothetical protein [Corallococcus carmarthensis]RKH05796.1 hypothetical protein D7X32_06795 [Corallococcus carmarthensis]